MSTRTAAAVAVLIGALGGLAGCADPSPPSSRSLTPVAPVETALPSTLTAYVDQDRVDRVGRAVYVRLVDEGPGTVTVTGHRCPPTGSRR